ncbi:type II and III secretion system protein family protein [Roseobacter denitrificans]|uniref:Type II/III secretion system protein, putative n=1 Tax=Roseobacter denitrificans (strain ATCC 33942 / OCh 114) TaxID=375451 RepID=Q167X6_ROSDO|nr:type II and III secretion system protein family protein [Roseobacter denitrificans]ABG31717.1 type II/III secretion system protein, putative [Roseobacter denitrificans OCh 114]AVL51306.1 type II and III secretion system protein family protein [Roseobacter denitrificans]SFF87882.1 pilus assembly protein CpaC [Roseobacter denitrificans OCh 114]
MKTNGILKAALLGLAISVSPIAFTAPLSAQAEALRIIARETSETLNVSQNRAVVVESEIPFAELSIANPGIADISSLSDRSIYVLGKVPGITTLTLLDAAGQLITNVEVRVAPDLTEFKERLRQILPGEAIEVRTANDGIVLSGQVSSSQRLSKALELAARYAPDRVSNLMTVGGVQQVMLKVRFAEMSRGVSKQLQSSLRIGGSDAQAGIGRGIGGIPNLAADSAQGAVFFDFGLGSTQVQLLLEALETKGAVRTLAEPNLVSLSGQEANFLAGGEYPVPVQSEDGISVDFKPFGIELNFVPRVVDGDLINLQLSAATSSIDPSNGISVGDGFTVDAFIRREASTTVEMRDGESFAIAGLLEDNFNDNITQVPWISDVPILGALFRSTDYMRNQTELVIIITAHLVTPTRGEALALPTDRIRPPSEKDLFLNGRTIETLNARGSAGEVAKQDFSGSYGYVMD